MCVTSLHVARSGQLLRDYEKFIVLRAHHWDLTLLKRVKSDYSPALIAEDSVRAALFVALQKGANLLIALRGYVDLVSMPDQLLRYHT